MRRPTDKYMAGIDLHSNNLVIGIVNQDGKRVAHRKVECDLAKVEELLKPYRKQMQSVAVESTFNWYWLVDGLRELRYPVVLANPAKIQQYSGMKHADDEDDAFHLAELQRLNILPTAHIYDARERPVRDLLRRRAKFVHHRTSLILSFKSLYARTTGQRLDLRETKKLEPAAAARLYKEPANQLIAGLQIGQMASLDKAIAEIERHVMGCDKAVGMYRRLETIPGIGRVLGLTIALEVGDIRRFASPGDFASYCRAVGAKRMSNGKSKGDNNQKCGNRYLAWAFVEAANCARRANPHCRRWFDRKAAKTNNVIATKALACKLAKAAWHVMADLVDYDEKRVFPELAMKTTS